MIVSGPRRLPARSSEPIGADISATIAAVAHRLRGRAATAIGFPAATDLDFARVTDLVNLYSNNIGEPWVPGAEPRQTKDLERELVQILASVFGASIDTSDDSWWGYSTSGCTEANLFAMRLGRERLPNAVVYRSSAAHYSVDKCARILGLDVVDVPSAADGVLDYNALRSSVADRRGRPAIVVATAGTTMTEAVDDTAAITAILDQYGVARHIHLDGALSGVPLALDDRWSDAVRLNTAHPPDSLCVSGHKFFGTPQPCGVVLARRRHVELVRTAVDYIAGSDMTITGSRPGSIAVLLWYALVHIGMDGHKARADASRDLAEYAVNRLRGIGWHAWRHPHAFTVVMRRPSAQLVRRWALAASGDYCHIVCMPGVTALQIDRFVTELTAELKCNREAG